MCAKGLKKRIMLFSKASYKKLIPIAGISILTGLLLIVYFQRFYKIFNEDVLKYLVIFPCFMFPLPIAQICRSIGARKGELIAFIDNLRVIYAKLAGLFLCIVHFATLKILSIWFHPIKKWLIIVLLVDIIICESTIILESLVRRSLLTTGFIDLMYIFALFDSSSGILCNMGKKTLGLSTNEFLLSGAIILFLLSFVLFPFFDRLN